jgi:hypothetical protein
MSFCTRFGTDVALKLGGTPKGKTWANHTTRGRVSNQLSNGCVKTKGSHYLKVVAGTFSRDLLTYFV